MPTVKPRKRGRAPAQHVQERVEEHPPAPTGPGSLVELPVESVRRYISHYKLPTAQPTSFAGFLLGGVVGKHSMAHAKYRRTSYKSASGLVMDHLSQGVVKESDTVAEFLYTVQHRDQVFKLRFGQESRAADAAARARNQHQPEDAQAGTQSPYGDTMEAEHSAPDVPDAHRSHSNIPLPVEPLRAGARDTHSPAAV